MQPIESLDFIAVSKQPELFRSAGRFILFPQMEASAGQNLAEAPPWVLHASFVGGPKRLPIRVKLRPA